MVLIFTDSNEYSVTGICDWLKHFNISTMLVDENADCECVFSDINSMNFTLKINDKLIHSSDITGTWFRKGPLEFNIPQVKLKGQDPFLNRILNKYLQLEMQTLSDYVNLLINKNLRTIGASKKLYINKLIQLQYAKEVGLEIPPSKIISNQQDYTRNFNNPTITKGIYDTFLFSTGTICGSAKIAQITEKNLFEWDAPLFQPSLFQNYIEKEFEVRSFYFKNHFYSMAIFSQNNPQTRIDFRNYDFDNPNRMVPFLLPVELENKLRILCTQLALDTGSFDLIYGKDGTFYFLEVNPVGQFSFVSGLCNYNLEKKVAEYFC